MNRKARDDSTQGKLYLASLAKKRAEKGDAELPFGMTYDPIDPKIHEEEYKAVRSVRPEWSKEEERHLLAVCILNREFVKAVYERDWSEAAKIGNLKTLLVRDLGLFTKSRDQAQARRDAESVSYLQEVRGSDPDFID